MNKKLHTICLLLAFLISAPAILAQDLTPVPFSPAAGFTTFTIPRAEKAPVSDGVISLGEWDHAVLLNNMANQTGSFLYLYARWTKWRLLWDADNLYLCSESQRLPNEPLQSVYRDQTQGGNTVMDDSIETHFTPGGRNVIGLKLPWSGQAIINPLGVGYFSQFTWAVAARSTTWVPDWKIGSKIGKDSWVIEMTIPRSSLDLPNPNAAGDAWSLLLARNWKCTGWNQSSLPANLNGFAVPAQHPRVYLTATAYAQLLDVSGLFRGSAQTQLALGTGSPTAQQVTIDLQIQSTELTNKNATPVKWQKTETLSVAPGALTPWQVNEAKAFPAGSYRYYLKVTAEGEAHPILETNFFFKTDDDKWLAEAAKGMVTKDYSFSASFAPTRSLLHVSVDTLYAPDPSIIGKLDVQVRDEKKTSILTASTSNQHLQYLEDDFQLPALLPGAYNCELTLYDKAGKSLAKNTIPFTKIDEAAKFPWWNFTGGETEKVLWPYQPVQVENGGAQSKYWGGVFYLDGLCLPRQLQVTANAEWRPALLEQRPSVLEREVTLSAQAKGKPAPVIMQGFPRTTTVKDQQATLRGYGKIGDDIEVQSDATFAQDGSLWVKLTLRPAIDVSSGRDVRRTSALLDQLTMDIPFRNEVARSMVAYGAPGYGSFTIGAIPRDAGVVWDSTKIGRSVLTVGNFLPQVWLGNEQRGLLFMAESNQGWEHKDQPDQQVVRNADEVILRLNLIQSPITLTGARSITFGLLPTPMRKMTPGWRMLNCDFSQNFADHASTGRMVSSSDPYNASVMPVSYEKSRLLMFYNTQSMLSRAGGVEFAPHTERGVYESISNDQEARNYFGAEWTQNTWTPAFQNHLAWNMQQWIDKGGFTGIYHDQFCPAPVTNSITGAAYRLPDGRTNSGYNLRADRLFNMREYALFLENGITPRIFCHTTNGGTLISYPWVTAILDGEDNLITANADYDFADIYSADRMQAYDTPWNWGNTFYWMILIQQGTPEWQQQQIRAYTGWTMIHDVMSANISLIPRPALFDWGMNDNNVKFWPYWRNKNIVSCSNSNVVVSMWTLPDRLLLCAFNTSKKTSAPQTIIRVPLADLGLQPEVRAQYLQATDMETGQPVTFDTWNAAITTNITPHDYKLLVIRRY